MGCERFEEELRRALEPTDGEVARLRAGALRSTPTRGRRFRGPALAAALLVAAAVLRWVVFDSETAVPSESMARFEIRGSGKLVVLADVRENRVSVLGTGRATNPRSESGPRLFISTGGTQP